MTTVPIHTGEPRGRLDDPRAWTALAVFAAAWFVAPRVVPEVAGMLGHLLHIADIPPHTLTQGALAVYTFPNLVWSFAVLCLIAIVLRRSPMGFPVGDAGWLVRGAQGLATGLAAMLLVVGGIWLTRAATITSSGQTFEETLRNGVAWAVLDFSIGASEELFYRGALYLAVASFIGWRGALIVSGLLFVALHVGNPGASPMWLVRIALSGMLLAYAVHRTGSIWWSIGYHTGWNWVSAPLFGAPGSGYTDQGHLLNYTAHGAELITGGAIGPEGSVFAYLAMLVAFAILVMTTARQHPRLQPKRL